VLVVDSAWRVLLLHGSDPARVDRRSWFTVGGGLEPGETLRDAALRELREETNLRTTPGALGEPVFHEIAEFTFDGLWYRQEQKYFLLLVDSPAIHLATQSAIEMASSDACRWWSADDLRTTREQYYPAALPDLLNHVRARERYHRFHPLATG